MEASTEVWGDVIARTEATDLEVLAQWFASEHHALLRLAVLLSGDRASAEDLVQETFVRVSRARIEPAGFPAYARRTLVNLSRSRFRSRARERRALQRAYARDVVHPPDLEQRSALWEQVRALSSTQRACIVLRFYEDLSDDDIATTLGTSVGSVRQQIHKAMSKLRGTVTS